MLQYEVVERSDAPPEAVFALLADGPGWQRWAGPLVRRSHWHRQGVTEPGGVGAVRKMGSAPVWSLEEIVEFDPPRHMTYVLLSGVPVDDYRADVDLAPDGTGTRITWKGRFKPRIPGTGPIFLLLFRTSVTGFARRLAKAAGEVPRPSA